MEVADTKSTLVTDVTTTTFQDLRENENIKKTLELMTRDLTGNVSKFTTLDKAFLDKAKEISEETIWKITKGKLEKQKFDFSSMLLQLTQMLMQGATLSNDCTLMGSIHEAVRAHKI
jgi:hypothetical protein